MLFKAVNSPLFVCGVLLAGTTTAEVRRTYIVNLAVPDDANSNPLSRRSMMLDVQSEAQIDQPAVVYNYANALHGFSASLTADQVAKLNAHDKVLSVREEKVYQVHTTRTPGFLGIAESQDLLGPRSFEFGGMSMAKREINSAEANLVIGMLDTGIWPEHPSLDDTGYPAIPSHWKGSCDVGERWTKANCNKKLVGAAYFYQGYINGVTGGNATNFNWTETGDIKSARDGEGHGTHTATTAAGGRHLNASLYGQGQGTARGMAPDARLAVYKVCWAQGCFETDLLAAMDRAISDGVNVISASLGGNPDFEPGALTSGAFVAMENGISTTLSGGNSGPDQGSVTNHAPWTITVAASTLDRDFPATVVTGDNQTFTGASLYNNHADTGSKAISSSDSFPLIAGSKAGNNVTKSTLCLPDSLDPSAVAGKVVICTRGQNARVNKGETVKKAGGRGMILVNTEPTGKDLIADSHLLPALHVDFKDGARILKYAESKDAKVSLDFHGTRNGVPAPKLAAFSSRGPNTPLLQIMKPDITGPGVNVLAGWTALAGPSSVAEDTRNVTFNIISGTSMSAPHLGGIAAYIKARRPTFSVTAIQSAIMTTAYTTVKGGKDALIDLATSRAATPFDYGNGHVDPVAALDPGLVYEITPKEYKEFLCSVNKTQAFMTGMTGSKFPCKADQEYSPYDLNYPSFGAFYNASASRGVYTAKFKRTLTSVDGAGKYKAAISLASKELVEVTVTPDTLEFGKAGDTQSFELTVKMQPRLGGDSGQNGTFLTSQGRLVWSDGNHTVGSSLGFIWGNGLEDENSDQ